MVLILNWTFRHCCEVDCAFIGEERPKNGMPRFALPLTFAYFPDIRSKPSTVLLGLRFLGREK